MGSSLIAGADTAMLPLLSSFDGMLQESRTGAKYEGGPDPQDTQYAESRFSRSTTTMRDGADRQNFPRVAPAGSVPYNTPREANQNFAFSSEQAEPFKPCPAPESRVEADVELVEQHLKVFSLQGLRTMGK